MHSLESYYNPAPQHVLPCDSDSDMQFDFMDANADSAADAYTSSSLIGGHPAVDLAGTDDSSTLSDTIFFRVHGSSPASAKLPLYVPKLNSAEPICINQLIVIRNDGVGIVDVALEDSEGQATQPLMVIEPTTLSGHTLKTLQKWDIMEGLHYSFGLKAESTLEDALSEVTASLIETKKADCATFELVHADDAHCKKYILFASRYPTSPSEGSLLYASLGRSIARSIARSLGRSIA